MGLMELFRMLPDNDKAEDWICKTRWPEEVAYPKCGSVNVHQKNKPRPLGWRCRDCRKDFSVKTDTIMHGSNLGQFQTWDNCCASADYQLEVRIVDEATSGLGDHSENSLASCSPYSEDLEDIVQMPRSLVQ